MVDVLEVNVTAQDTHLPLTNEYIKDGNILWYYGHTSTFAWNCPAEIINVDTKQRTFQVRSLDDMEIQTQRYDFDLDDHSPSSRQSMTIPPIEQVLNYLKVRGGAVLTEVESLKVKILKAEKLVSKIQEQVSRLESLKEKDA